MGLMKRHSNFSLILFPSPSVLLPLEIAPARKTVPSKFSRSCKNPSDVRGLKCQIATLIKKAIITKILQKLKKSHLIPSRFITQ